MFLLRCDYRAYRLPEFRAVLEFGQVQLHMTAGHLTDGKHNILLGRITAQSVNAYKHSYIVTYIHTYRYIIKGKS